jgi:hypothetical protein
MFMCTYCYVNVFLLLCMFCSVYFVLLCCSIYCLCVNVYCTTATGRQTNCSWNVSHRIVSYHIIMTTYIEAGIPQFSNWPTYRGSITSRNKTLLQIVHAGSRTHCVYSAGTSGLPIHATAASWPNHLHAVPRLSVSGTRTPLPSTPVYLSQNSTCFHSSTEWWWDVYSTGT